LLEKDFPPNGITCRRTSVRGSIPRGLRLSLRPDQETGCADQDQAGCENDVKRIAESEFDGVFHSSFFDSLSSS
jgi:hypothetical protein